MKILLKWLTYGTAPKPYLLYNLLFVGTSTRSEKKITDSKASKE